MHTGRMAVAITALIAAFNVAQAAGVEPQCRVPTDAQAERGCIWMLPITSPPPTGVVLLDRIKGDVVKSDAVGFTPVTEPTWLTVGDGVLVKSASSATLVAGANCQREIGPNVSVVINQIDDGFACAVLAGEKQVGKGSVHHALLALGIGAGAVLLIKHFDHPVSP